MKDTVIRWLRRYKEIFFDLISFVGIIWILIEITSYVSSGAADPWLKNSNFLFVLLFFALAIALAKNKPKTSFGYHLRGKDNRIEVRIGDAVKNPGAVVVPVNDQFDMSLGGNVLKANSIQRQLIDKFYAGRVEHLNADIAEQVDIGHKYPVGKTIEVEQKGRKFYLLVNSHKKDNNRVSSEIDDFIQTLNCLWQYIALETGRDTNVSIPVINTQHGRDSYLCRMSAIKEIITSYVEASKSLNVCDQLTISIHPSDLKKGNLDLDELDDFLRFSCRHYRQVTLREKTDDPTQSSKVIRIDN